MNFITSIYVLAVLFHHCHAKSILMSKEEKNSKRGGEEDVDIQMIDPHVNPKEAVFEENNVAPPKHLDAVKINRDGHLNSNFHKEVFLGEDIENFENGNYKLKEQKKQLENIFKLIDVNNDKRLDVTELSSWVMKKTSEHFEEAKNENKDKFTRLDIDQDGRLTWNEYLVEFLSQSGFDRSVVEANLMKKQKLEIGEELNDVVEDFRDKWIQAAGDAEDVESLSSDQFLDFQHPEASRGMLAYMVEDLLHDIDTNGDQILTVHEYMAVPSDVDVDTQKDTWAVERREEFRNVIDQNHDGNVTKVELERYLDPLSKTMSEQEARQLISFGDENGDEMLSLPELLENSEFYTGSKLYNYALSVHEDL